MSEYGVWSLKHNAFVDGGEALNHRQATLVRRDFIDEDPESMYDLTVRMVCPHHLERLADDCDDCRADQ
jgi:hypothetical protein